MKKTVIYLVALALTILAQSSCKDGKQVAEVADTNDSIIAEDAQLPQTESQEAPVEKIEKKNGMYAPEDVAKIWKTRTISVPGQASDIVALFEAFYNEWPTVEGNRIAHMVNPSSVPADESYEDGSEIDRKNGYVESAWYEGEPLGVVSACVWKRKNGHKLFAVNFGVEKDFLCFYDFDPAKRTLTPEESPVKREHLNFPDKDILWYELPHEGKTLKVVEDAEGDNVAFTYYDFDGQNLKFAGHEK